MVTAMLPLLLQLGLSLHPPLHDRPQLCLTGTLTIRRMCEIARRAARPERPHGFGDELTFYFNSRKLQPQEKLSTPAQRPRGGFLD
jgi:hypothetical protein